MTAGTDASPSQPSTPGAGLWNVPNAFSLSRLVATLVVFVLIAIEQYRLAFPIFVLAACTDWVDGYLARKLNQATAFGRQLDPLIDKLMVCGLFVFLLPIPNTGLSAWMVAVVIFRELIIQWLRSLMEGRGVAFGAKMAGKLKATFQFLAIGAVLVGLGWPEFLESLGWWVRDVLIWVAILLTIQSGLEYLIGALPKLRHLAD